MYLKRLELQGFKSFADRTIFEFSPGVSAIVGPNGSGKSNVVDAVRWVLGEQSAKTLRGGKMEDVIFSGSHGRKPVGMAKVTLILDNSDGGLPLDYAEVAVARTLYRSGESRYEINRQGVRLRDVQELFMDTGLGKDGFSVIGQGKIDDILSLQADERRGLIEEAAGISKYKYRKREAERRLASTEGDIDRLEDIFYELDSRLPALAEQAEAVERYQALDQQEKAVHLAQLVSAYDEAQAQHERVGNQLAEAEEAYVATVKAVQEVTAEDTEARHLRMQTADALQALNERHLELVQRHDEAAREAAVVSERLRQLEGLLTEDGQRLAQEKAKWGQGEDHLRQLAEKERGLSEARDALKAELAQLDDALSGHRRLRDRDSQALEALAQAQFAVLREQSDARNRLARLEEQAKGDDQRSARHQQAAAQLAEKEAEVQARSDAARQAVTDSAEQVQAAETALVAVQKEIDVNRSQAEKTAEKLAALNKERIQTESRLKALGELEAAGAGYYGGVQAVLKHQKELTGLVGTVAQRISFDPQYGPALESALGGAAQHIIAENDAAAQRAINWLKQSKSGRATFLPRNTVRGGAPGKALEDPAFIGYAVDLVRFAAEDEGIMRQLLGRIAIVKTLPDAVRLAKLGGFRQRLVTLEGDLVSPGGSLSGGRGRGQSVLSRTAERLTLKERLTTLVQAETDAETAVTDWRALLAQANDRLSSCRDHLSEARQRHALALQEQEAVEKDLAAVERETRALDLEADRMTADQREREAAVTAAQADLSAALAQFADNEAEEKRLKERLAESGGEDDSLVEKRQNCQVALAQAQESLRHQAESVREAQDRQLALGKELESLSALQTSRQREVAALRQTLADNNTDATSAEADLTTAQKELLTLREDLQHWQRRESDLSLRLRELTGERDRAKDGYDKLLAQVIRIRDKSDQAVQTVTEGFELTMAEAADRADKSLLETYGAKDLARWRREKAAMGPLNFNAPEEYAALSERSSFLRAQLDDLEGAKKRLEKVIAEMETVMATRFAETFHELNDRFNRIFQQIFRGGQAHLALSMPENILETGVDIMAQPPGKRERTLTLLSGGERAMTAIALLFALLEVRPSPFVILDEIEAALDAANVERFARFIETYADGTQFVVISHRQGTMDAADRLYGVTMDKDGVSRLVSVRLEDYLEEED